MPDQFILLEKKKKKEQHLSDTWLISLEIILDESSHQLSVIISCYYNMLPLYWMHSYTTTHKSVCVYVHICFCLYLWMNSIEMQE